MGCWLLVGASHVFREVPIYQRGKQWDVDIFYLPQATMCCVYCCFVVSLTSMAAGAQGPAAGGLLQPTVLAKQALQIGAGKG